MENFSALFVAQADNHHPQPHSAWDQENLPLLLRVGGPPARPLPALTSRRLVAVPSTLCGNFQVVPS